MTQFIYIAALIAGINFFLFRQHAYISKISHLIISLTIGAYVLYSNIDILDFTWTDIENFAYSREVFLYAFAIAYSASVIFLYNRISSSTAWFSLLHYLFALGVICAQDFLNLIISWELMSVFSALMIYFDQSQRSRSISLNYIIYHGVGGGLFVLGLASHFLHTGSFSLSDFDINHAPSAFFLLLALLINASIFPFHTWLTRSYAESAPSSRIFLCSFTTKAAIFVLLTLFGGFKPLIFLGVISALFGVFYAFFQNQPRKILVYEMVSQLGIILMAIGMKSGFTAATVSIHSFSHVVYGLILFFSSYDFTSQSQVTAHDTEPNQTKSYSSVSIGFWLFAALAVSGMPFLNGYLGKSIISDYYHHTFLIYIFWFLTSATFLIMFLRPLYFWVIRSEVSAPPKTDFFQAYHLSPAILCLICLAIGLSPYFLNLPFSFFNLSHLLATFGLFLATATSFFIFRRQLSFQTKVFAYDLDTLFIKPRILFQNIAKLSKTFSESLSAFFQIRLGKLQKTVTSTERDRPVDIISQLELSESISLIVWFMAGCSILWFITH